MLSASQEDLAREKKEFKMGKKKRLLDTLSSLSDLCEWDNLPPDILKMIGFDEATHSGVSVYLKANKGEFLFSFHLHNPYEAADEVNLSPDEVYDVFYWK